MGFGRLAMEGKMKLRVFFGWLNHRRHLRDETIPLLGE